MWRAVFDESTAGVGGCVGDGRALVESRRCTAFHGDLALAADAEASEEAERHFGHALDLGAHSHSRRSLELRAATSLARLWAEQGERQKAHDLLAPLYAWFTEGFDTADLKDAKAILDEVA